MHYLIDGYNLAHWLAGGADLSAEQLRQLTLRRLQARLPGDARSVDVYWDTRRATGFLGERESLGWCTLHFVPSADEAILDAVYRHPTPQKLVVVSRDREVTGKGKQLGARVRGPAELFPK